MRCVLTAIALLSAAPVFAQDWNVRPWDDVMHVDEVQALLVGETVAFASGGSSYYGPDGRYKYAYKGGNTFEGDYALQSDGSICVEFDNGRRRCDLYVRQGDRLVLITETGRRFPGRL